MYDIIIVGGGMVGAALACALAQRTSLSILILEAQSHLPTWSAQHYHHRVSAIALSSQRIFQSLQVWDEIKNNRISPFTGIHVWDAAKQGAIHFDCYEIAESVLGFIIENNLIQSVLQKKLEQYPQVNFVSSVQLKRFVEKANHIELHTNDGTIFSAKLAIAADGAHSWLREQANIQIEKHDYQQHAIVAAVRTAKSHEKIARQVFLETGPLAFLPLAEENLSSIVWSLSPEKAEQLLSLSDDLFMLELAHAFQHTLGDVTEISKRHAFPLHKQQAKHYVHSRVVLVGDAAHTIHPLAGQGVNMGLLDAASLVDVIVGAIRSHRDFASAHNLRPYERWRKADNFALQAGVDVIKQLFASDKPSVQSLRSFGLDVTNRMQWIKNIFTSHAVGDRDGLPLLATKEI